MMALAARVPGFGGMFVDSDGVLTVRLTGAAHRATAEREVASFVARGGRPRPTRWISARHSFASLYEWRGLARGLLGHAGVTLVDLDERDNRVRIGVAPGYDQSEVARLAEASGIPADAIEFIVASPPEPASTLRDEVRPVRGGLEIGAYGKFEKICTLGFIAWRPGQLLDPLFVTNSHCSDHRSVLDSTRFVQPSFDQGSVGIDTIGVEIADPPFFSGGACPSGQLCRYSDASLARLDTAALSPAVQPYQIARTLSRGRLTGSLEIDPDPTHRFVIAPRATFGAPLVGDSLHKVGRTSGWTYGPLVSTCVDVPNPTLGIILLCQNFVDAGADGGDSGSPVFAWPDEGSQWVKLVGLLHGQQTLQAGKVLIYSPVENVEADLGPLCENRLPAACP